MNIKKIDEPWTFEDIKKAYFSDFRKTDKIINDTEGGVLWGHLGNIEECLDIFTSCANDVLDGISIFAHETTKDGFWYQTNKDQQTRLASRVKKDLFCTSSSAMALVDHARRFSKKYPVDLADEKRKSIFLPVGIHGFIQGLRNYILHVKIAEANWEVKTDFRNKKREVNFYLSNKDLEQYDSWTSEAKVFIEQHEKGINVYDTILKYSDCVNKYYRWHKAAVIERYYESLCLYFKYKKYQKQIQSRTSWNLIISHIKSDVDIFQNLSKYLKNEEIEDILSYPLKSESQIDRLIEIVDKNNACDDVLREKIHSRLGLT